jgi:hypothetical protein
LITAPVPPLVIVYVNGNAGAGALDVTATTTGSQLGGTMEAVGV